MAVSPKRREMEERIAQIKNKGRRTFNRRAMESQSLRQRLEGKTPCEQANMLVAAAKMKSPELRELPKWNLDWQGADLRGVKDLNLVPGLRFINLAGAKLDGQDLSRVDLRGARMDYASLSGANLKGANLGGAHLNNAQMQATNLTDANFSGVHAAGANFSNSLVTRTNFDYVQGRGANFDYIRGHELRMNNAEIPGATMRGADLKEASISGNLTNVDMTNARLEDPHVGKDLENAKVKPEIVVSQNMAFGGLFNPMASVSKYASLKMIQQLVAGAPTLMALSSAQPSQTASLNSIKQLVANSPIVATGFDMPKPSASAANDEEQPEEPTMGAHFHQRFLARQRAALAPAPAA